jgi:hypothetical protein
VRTIVSLAFDGVGAAVAAFGLAGVVLASAGAVWAVATEKMALIAPTRRIQRQSAAERFGGVIV